MSFYILLICIKKYKAKNRLTFTYMDCSIMEIAQISCTLTTGE